MRITLLLSLMILASYVHADDFKLNDGTEYKSATVSRVEPDGIIVIILTGVIKLYFTDLPNAVRQKYHYDPYAARRFAGERPESAESQRVQIAAAEEHEAKLAAMAARGAAIASGDQESARARASDLSLEAHEISSGNPFESNWETSWGSYDRSYSYGKRLLITVRDLARRALFCDVDVYFIGRPVFDASSRFIYDRKSFRPQFRGRIEISGPVGAADLHSRIQSYAALGEKYGSGADFDG
jgi:hypothetical protein